MMDSAAGKPTPFREQVLEYDIFRIATQGIRDGTITAHQMTDLVDAIERLVRHRSASTVVADRVYDKIVEHADKVADANSSEAYVKGMVSKAIIDESRRRAKEDKYEENVTHHRIESPEEIAVRDERVGMYHDASVNLSPRQRDTMHRRFWKGESLAEIASAQGVGVAAIANRISRAKKVIGKELADANI